MSSTLESGNSRIAELILAARDFMGSKGKLWIQGQEKKYGYDENKRTDRLIGVCMIGALKEVPGFSDEERYLAQVELAQLIRKGDNRFGDLDTFLDNALQDAIYDGYFTDLEIEDGTAKLSEDDVWSLKLDWAQDIIASSNDNPGTMFENVRTWMSNAARRLKGR